MDTVEIGITGRETPLFKKMSREEVAVYVEQFKQ
jgi:hypothetical protein